MKDERGQPEQLPSPGRSDPPRWDRTMLWICVLVLAAGSGLFVFQSCLELPGRAVDKTVDKTIQVVTNVSQSLARLASAFHQGTVTLSLTSTGTELENTKYFQFKKIKQTEIFTHTDLATTAFGYLPLPEVIVEARAPVEYTYYLDLEEPWRLHLKGDQVHVFTPPIHYNNPSVDISRLEYEIKQDSMFRDAEVAFDNLKKSLTTLAWLKARENIRLVKDSGRVPVAEFVQQWLIRSFADGSNYTVHVYFPGDTPPPGGTLELKEVEAVLGSPKDGL